MNKEKKKEIIAVDLSIKEEKEVHKTAIYAKGPRAVTIIEKEEFSSKKSRKTIKSRKANK